MMSENPLKTLSRLGQVYIEQTEVSDIVERQKSEKSLQGTGYKCVCFLCHIFKVQRLNMEITNLEKAKKKVLQTIKKP